MADVNNPAFSVCYDLLLLAFNVTLSVLLTIHTIFLCFFFLNCLLAEHTQS